MDDYARVTLDCNMKYCLQDSFEFNTQELLNYDHQGLFSELQNDQANVVLDLKIQNRRNTRLDAGFGTPFRAEANCFF